VGNEVSRDVEYRDVSKSTAIKLDGFHHHNFLDAICCSPGGSDPQGISGFDFDSTRDPLSLSKLILAAHPLLSDHPPILPKLPTPSRFQPGPFRRCRTCPPLSGSLHSSRGQSGSNLPVAWIQDEHRDPMFQHARHVAVDQP
jgi:hypothetical protein